MMSKGNIQITLLILKWTLIYNKKTVTITIKHSVTVFYNVPI